MGILISMSDTDTTFSCQKNFLGLGLRRSSSSCIFILVTLTFLWHILYVNKSTTKGKVRSSYVELKCQKIDWSEYCNALNNFIGKRS